VNIKKHASILENSISLFSLKAINLGLSLWLIPFLILRVGLHNYGLYAFAMSLILFFVNLLNYGFNLATVREIAKIKGDRSRLQSIFNEILSVKLVLFVGLFFLFLMLVFLVPKFEEQKTLYLFSSLLLFGDLFSLRWFFMGLEKMKYIALIHLLGTVIFVLLVIQFVNFHEDYSRIPLYEGIGMSISTIVSFVWVIKVYKIKIKLISLSAIYSYLRQNFSSFINLLLPSTYGISIVFLVGVFGLPYQVSLMQIGVKFTAAFSTANNILTNVFYPIVNRRKTAMFSTRSILLGVGIMLSSSMYIFADYLISNWLTFENSTELENTVKIIEILSPIPFLMALISAYGVNGLLTDYKDKLFSAITLVSTLSMVISACYLIPEYPIFGGAISFLIGRFIYAGASYYFFKKQKI